MKQILLKNRVNNDIVVCDNIKEIELIDGIEYITVRKPDNLRKFKMRKDVLEILKSSNIHKVKK